MPTPFPGMDPFLEDPRGGLIFTTDLSTVGPR